MDPVVLQAMQKWPDLPHCYGWLGLDARGNWRMRDEYVQQHQLRGEKITHPALVDFINRNYLADSHGAWYFQNGPQRVYVELELTPYIAHTNSEQKFVWQTGQTMDGIEAVMLTETGGMLLIAAGQVAAVDDRDLAFCLKKLRMNGKMVEDETLCSWLSTAKPPTNLTWQYTQTELVVTRIATADIARYFGFTQHPNSTLAQSNHTT